MNSLRMVTALASFFSFSITSWSYSGDAILNLVDSMSYPRESSMDKTAVTELLDRWY